ncbi:rod-binding protein [Devosia sp. BSSL-BM10]|jgi:peptidoglycan hydrolase FlgJ|uniref:Rod-binding protein n=1 Tax=Devosia litorisediminis TaxID=2829817 RepID=A0A942E473_9HYPH|nr:rod-binding protein [Devosia litorisediminis]MBS3847893.1 rod-binding protein [Devosia litorisediminis]
MPTINSIGTSDHSTLTPAQIARVQQQAQEFEGVFLNTLTKQLFTSLKTDESAMGGGFGEETWRSMQAEQMADTLSQNGGLGIAEQLLPDLLAMQEASNNQNKIMPTTGVYK